jgi:hypothetical protein
MDPREKLIEVAQSFIGTREEGGDNRGARVEEFQRAVDGRAEREPWCACFAQFCIMRVEEFLAVRSPVFKSEHCLTVWERSPRELRLEAPEPGCLMIWQHAGTSSGHVGIVASVGEGYVDTVEGNTGSGQEVERDGDGVYMRTRTLKGSPKMRVVGWLRVFLE